MTITVFTQVALSVLFTVITLVLLSLLIGPIRRRLYETVQDDQRRIRDLQRQIAELKAAHDADRKAHEEDRKRWESERMTLYGRMFDLEKKVDDLQVKNTALTAQIGNRKNAEIVILGVWSGDDLDTLAERDAVYDAGFEYYSLRGEAATRANILRELRTGKYAILEVGSHGDADALLIGKQELSAGWWRRALKDRGVRVAVVLACFSDSSVADAMKAAGVQHVIGVNGAIDDSAAVEFAQQFYELFAAGMDVRQAFDEAKMALDYRQGEKLVLR